MKITRLFQVLIIASLLFTIGGSPPQTASAAKAQPQLVQMAAVKPDARVRVIAQKTAGAEGVEALVAKLGGRVTSNLSIINAFTAEMKAEAALQLARSSSVRWVSLDGAMEHSGKTTPPAIPTQNFYLDTMRVRNAWKMGLDGSGIGVAVVDSGITTDADFTFNPLPKSFTVNSNNVNDIYGHGTHVAGIIAGNGKDSNGLYKGVAPGVKLINLKIADGTGMAYESDVVAALQWAYENKTTYNIRVVNLSLNTTTEQSYNVSPLDAACEILWFNGIVVVVSSGNKGSGTYNTANASPANDPFVLSVGAVDEKGTTSTSDDSYAPYTSYGTTMDGYLVPNIVAPGSNIYSVLSKSSSWGADYPERLDSTGEYFRLSGTSMAAPMVTGAVALLLQDEPNLTPDQVKYRLLNNSGRNITLTTGTGKNAITYYFPYLDVYSVVTGTTTASANQGILPSQLLTTGTDPIAWGSVGWNSVGWNSVGWNSVGWNSVGWNSVGWNSVGWNSTYWGP
jgi:serine protease AprX